MNKEEIFFRLKTLERRDLDFVERIKIKKYFEQIFNEYFFESKTIETSEVLHLTKREKEVSEFVARGFTNNEVSSALEISIKTVEFHLSSVIRKTETSNRTEAMSYLIKNDLISY